MSEATQTPSIEETLNKTDLGHTVYENRKVFFGLLLAILVGATAYLVYKQTSHSSAMDASVKVFEFQNGVWADAKAGKTPAADLVKAFEGLDQEALQSPVMLPVALEIGKFLADKGSYTEAETVLSKLNVKHPVSLFFISMQRAVVLEKLGKVDEAIAVLEPVAQNKENVMPARVSLELGRLYLVKGEKGKAQTQFDYVVSSFPNGEEAKLAKLYLAELAAK